MLEQTAPIGPAAPELPTVLINKFNIFITDGVGRIAFGTQITADGPTAYHFAAMITHENLTALSGLIDRTLEKHLRQHIQKPEAATTH